MHFLPSGSLFLPLYDTWPFLFLVFASALDFVFAWMNPSSMTFYSIRATQTTQSWRTLCKTLNTKEGMATTMSTSTNTTIMSMKLMTQTGRQRAKTAHTPRHICGPQWQEGRSRIQAQTPVYRRAEVWSLTCRLLAPPGPRVPGADLTRMIIMR